MDYNKGNLTSLIKQYKTAKNGFERDKYFYKIYQKYIKILNRKMDIWEKDYKTSSVDILAEAKRTLWLCLEGYNFNAPFKTYYFQALSHNLYREFEPEMQYRKYVSIVPQERVQELFEQRECNNLENYDDPEKMYGLQIKEIMSNVPKDKGKYILYKRCIEGNSFGEIGEELNCSKQAVQQLYDRTVKRVRLSMEEEEDGNI